jgi:hypothetical protein
MKVLFCCGVATHASLGQSSLWRWWYYYRPLKELFGATHYAVSNEGDTNLPTELFVKLHKGDAVIGALSENQLNIVYWPEILPRKSRYINPGYHRHVSALVRIALEQDFDKIVYIEWDFWVLAREMMREIARINHGLITYWSPLYAFPDCNIIICCKDRFQALKTASDEAREKTNATSADIPELCFPWTEVRKHRVGDRYPEKSDVLPLTAEYCAQMPNTHVVHEHKLVSLAQSLCRQCGSVIVFDAVGVLKCSNCVNLQQAQLAALSSVTQSISESVSVVVVPSSCPSLPAQYDPSEEFRAPGV